MNDYRVGWEIDVEADSPTDAVLEVARQYFQGRIVRGEVDTACVFKVQGGGCDESIDLAKLDNSLSTEQLQIRYTPGEHPVWLQDNWVDEVRSGDTLLGYWAWVKEKIEGARQ